MNHADRRQRREVGQAAEDGPAGAALPAGHRRRGWQTTVRHIVWRCSARRSRSSTPRCEPNLPPNYRGVHRLNRDEQGRVKCVACYMCSTACPAHCIDIVAAAVAAGRTARSIPRRSSSTSCAASTAACARRPARCDAIELTTLYDLTGLSREEMMFDKEKLLSVFDQTVEDGHRPGPDQGRPAQRRQRAGRRRADVLLDGRRVETAGRSIARDSLTLTDRMANSHD